MIAATPTQILHRLAPFAVAAVLSGCSDSDDVVQPFDLNDLADQLTRVASGVILDDPTQASANDLRQSIGFIMTREGFPSLAREAEGGRSAEVGPAERSVSILDAMTASLPSPVPPNPAPRPPLGTTCDWNVETDGWKLDPEDKLGPPPEDGVRFELYETLGATPVVPLDPTGTFVDVIPTTQGGSGSSVIDVTINAMPTGSSDVLFDYNLTGTSTPDVLDLFMEGTIDNAGGLLNFFFTVDQIRGSAGGAIEDLLLETQVGVDFAGTANEVVVVDKLNSMNLEFALDFDSQTGAIANGEVRIDAELVATMTGSRSQPVFNILSPALTSQDRINLTSIFLNSRTITGRVTDFFLLAHCIGSERPEECERL